MKDLRDLKAGLKFPRMAGEEPFDQSLAAFEWALAAITLAPNRARSNIVGSLDFRGSEFRGWDLTGLGVCGSGNRGLGVGGGLG